MKKILFATTALIATAGMAAADVRISGYGRFGLDYNENNDRLGNISQGALNGRSETNITSRLRLQFDMDTETDGGVTLGARFRAQAESRDNAPGGAAFNGARFFASYGGFELGVGNIQGALEWMPGLYLETRTAGVGIDGAGFDSLVTNVNTSNNVTIASNRTTGSEGFNWDFYTSAGAGSNGVEIKYSAGAFGAHLSYSNDNGTVLLPNVSPDRIAGHVSYTFGDWTAALGFQSSDIRWEDKTVVTVSGDLGQFGVRLAYADNDGIDKFGIYGNMDIGSNSNILVYVTDEDAVSLADIAAGRADNRDTVANLGQGSEGTGYGVHYSYDLGGGASFEAGIRENSWDNTTVQAGVYFSF